MPKSKYKLLVAENEAESRAMLHGYFDQKTGLKCVGCCASGVETLQAVRDFRPDIVLLDLLLPQKDGMAVLAELRKFSLPHRPHVVMTGSAVTDNTVRDAIRGGAEYFIVKPYDLASVMDRLAEICRRPVLSAEATMRAAVSRMALQMGVSPNVTGYTYVVDGVVILLTEDGVCSIKKDVYEVVARKNNTTVQCVENALHTVLDHAQEARTPYIRSLMQEHGMNETEHLTNSKFLTLMAEILRMQEVVEPSERTAFLA